MRYYGQIEGPGGVRDVEHRIAATAAPDRPARARDRLVSGCGFVYDDGGRAEAGFVGDAGDCVTRAISIALGQDYRDVYDRLALRMAARGEPRSARNGIPRAVYESYLDAHGWRWVPTMEIGSGCRVHLRPDELPPGRLIARLSKHVCAVVDGVVRDTHDPTREGTRCVYGLFLPACAGIAIPLESEGSTRGGTT
jgi:hypothetical protein